jgi:hypothetical protein
VWTRFERDGCAAVERLALETKAGRRVAADDTDPLTWELLLLWRRREAEHEAAARESLQTLNANVAALIAAFAEKKS